MNPPDTTTASAPGATVIEPDAPKPGIKTSEGQFAGVAGVGMLIPIVNSVLSKTGDTRFEVACLTLLAISYMVCRTYAKR
jgi:hypothetical protein